MGAYRSPDDCRINASPFSDDELLSYSFLSTAQIAKLDSSVTSNGAPSICFSTKLHKEGEDKIENGAEANLAIPVIKGEEPTDDEGSSSQLENGNTNCERESHDYEETDESLVRVARLLEHRLRQLECDVSAPTKCRRKHAYSFGWGIAEKLDELMRSRIACPTIPTTADPNTFSITSRFKIQNHCGMTTDKHRMEFYQKAINELSLGKSVLEIGTGPFAVWAINAARAGATSVTALEVSKTAAAEAEAIVRMYGYENIQVKNSYSKEYAFEKQYDLIVHEIIGDFVGNEGVADIISDVQRRTGSLPRSIPRAARSYISPVTFPEPHHIKFPHSKFYQRTIVSPSKKMLQSVGLVYSPLLLSEFQAFEVLNFEEELETQLYQWRTLEFTITKPGALCGLIMTNEVEVLPGVTFGTKHAGMWDHWYSNIILLQHEVNVVAGDKVIVKTTVDLRNYQHTFLHDSETLADMKEESVTKDSRVKRGTKSVKARNRSMKDRNSTPMPSGIAQQELAKEGGHRMLELSCPSYSFKICIIPEDGKYRASHYFPKICIDYREQSPCVGKNET
ncbi:hypothetical protein IE077_002568 [Cardiosporidium cionae]|uniref:Uncharacterized protein n=1 Tax=Cardiosporidium cionae TaxID=476202 RepID=A0ABQ7JAJ5_9APIC|nr:hypothetical protein IE077_002568 [Cardiosporidium cionae]|eukprot:KAF8821011.1 hypothetical protein IE077_002568 [Cardiosporidium cionae]